MMVAIQRNFSQRPQTITGARKLIPPVRLHETGREWAPEVAARRGSVRDTGVDMRSGIYAGHTDQDWNKADSGNVGHTPESASPEYIPEIPAYYSK